MVNAIDSCIHVHPDDSPCETVQGCTAVEKCDSVHNYCHAVFENTSKGMEIRFAGCWNYCETPSRNSCVVRGPGNRDHFGCCCSANNCNKHPVFAIDNREITVTTPKACK